MLEQVEIVSENGSYLPLPLGDPSSGITVESIQGLEPVKATLSSSKYALKDGEYFHASRRGSRNILIGLGLDPRYGGGSVSALRRQLYSVLSPETKVDMTFSMAGEPPVVISGVVESLDTPMFTKTPMAMASIVCYDPDFVDPVEVLNTGEGYPFSIAWRPVEYDGSVPTGFRLELYMNALGTGEGFVVYVRHPNGDVQTLEFRAPLQGEDIIHISTVPGDKYAKLIRDGSESSILYGVSPQAQWGYFMPGSNEFGVQVTGDTEQSYYEFYHNKRYGGL